MRLLALATIAAAALITACGGESNDDLERRIAALEAQPQMGNLIVVGKEMNVLGAAAEVCVRYRVFEATDETCQLLGQAQLDCSREARIGEPLPECWRGGVANDKPDLSGLVEANVTTCETEERGFPEAVGTVRNNSEDIVDVIIDIQFLGRSRFVVANQSDEVRGLRPNQVGEWRGSPYVRVGWTSCEPQIGRVVPSRR